MKSLILRTVTGVLFVAVMVSCIYLSQVNQLPFVVLFALLSGCTAMEFATIINRRGDVKLNRAITAMAASFLFVAVWFNAAMEPSMTLFVPYIAAMIYLLVAELYRKSEHALNNWAFTLMAQAYVAVPFALLNKLEFFYGNLLTPTPIYVLGVFIFLWCSDTGAYCTGSLIGKHKLFPSVSPGKTWEGSIGGAVLAIAASQLICVLTKDNLVALPDVTEAVKPQLAGSYMLNIFWAGMALTVVVFGTWGDLIESLLKRRLGIKDSGNALPGHGGWLDRFDSTLLAVPAVVVYMLCWR